MPVIKNPGPEVSINRRPPAVSPDVEAVSDAQRIIDDAQRAADTTIAEAQRQAEQMVQDFRASGKREGTDQVSEDLSRAAMQASEVAKQVEPDLVLLAIGVAEKLIAHDLERSPELIADICANAVETLRNAKQMTLRMHPKDAALLREHKAALMERIARPIDISIKDDSEITHFGVVIQTEFGTIDAQLPTQLQLVRDTLIVDGAKKEGPA